MRKQCLEINTKQVNSQDNLKSLCLLGCYLLTTDLSTETVDK